ncbi:protein IMPAIRED IN BABA-INDUCED STERILITY 1-like isoform X1 [Musa acuminata AAA Group]|uniref:protein IMPAIRED IN BABA-INDUCED STERILITY 1-like isoform X1 n=1 Tax=Musa acuminata AAA Group TaxID=214697 RepID=UPI0031D60780
MGCVASKKTVSVTPALDSSGVLRDHREGSEAVSASSSRCRAGQGCREEEQEGEGAGCRQGDPGKASAISGSLQSLRLGNFHKYIEGEQVAAGWPAWLSAVAGEAIQGWVPLKADSFEKLEKIGQGTYSSVFRAQDLDTGKVVALKKVRFDNFEPESVRFMAREILILRRLDHPNVVKLEGLITSRLSCSLYLVFEYMEHDLAGLSACPDIEFSEAQVKCYMQQLLSGLEHCHLHGVIHRDIKGANLLVNNDGVLKMADFGLANFCSTKHKQPLTSRVVTLWYRPPELLLGSTNYEVSVDLWSVGCVFAEMFLGKPILQGRTEVEQLHKIFKLCGSPPDEYWKKSKLPHATIFKPHHPYESCLQDMFKNLPATAINLLETFLSVEPYKRGTASSALASEYFRTKPYAYEPSSLPKYPPNKEIDAKSREESHRRRIERRRHGPEAITRQPGAYRASREPSNAPGKIAESQESQVNRHGVTRSKVKQEHIRVNGEARLLSQEDAAFSGPLDVSASSGFAWAKRQREACAYDRSHSSSSSKSHVSGAVDPSNTVPDKAVLELGTHKNGDADETSAGSKGHDTYEQAKCKILKKWATLGRPDSFDSSDIHHSQDFSKVLFRGDPISAKRNFLGRQDEGDRVEFSGPLLSQSHKVDELLQKHERYIRQAVQRSWFQRVAGRRQRK